LQSAARDMHYKADKHAVLAWPKIRPGLGLWFVPACYWPGLCSGPGWNSGTANTISHWRPFVSTLGGGVLP